MNTLPPLPVEPTLAGQTLAAVLRARLPGVSWSQARALIAARRVKVRDELCLDDARRLNAGETVELLAAPLPRPRDLSSLVLPHVDEQIVVVEKPAGLCTVRHPSERWWAERRKALSPTLDDLVHKQLGGGPRLRIVHRLDKETSGLLVFARTVEAERGLGLQFRRHTVTRRYVALVSGQAHREVIRTTLVRDRGDGRRGTGTGPGARDAITHILDVEPLPGHSLITCRLETGRTHQIRIHLAERGTPVCGDKVYSHRKDGGRHEDLSGAPRLMLHAAELGIRHPSSGEEMHWVMPPPADMTRVIHRLRRMR
jgi:23S rRNA pseudouridine1911/1915/1917 synthase